MIQTCQKSFTIAPAVAATGLDLYWTFDKPGEPTAPDMFGQSHWTDQILTAAVSVNSFLMLASDFVLPGKIGNSAFTNPNIATGENQLTSGGITPAYDSSKNGFTMFGWFQYDAYPDNGDIKPLCDAFLGDVFGTPALGIDTQGTAGSPIFIVNPSLATFTPVLPAGFFFLCYTYECATGIERVYINSALVSTTGIAPIVATSQISLHVANSVGGCRVRADEFGVSFSKAYSQARITALYNGGAGVTWPAVNSI